MKTLGSRLKGLRTESNLTIEELANVFNQKFGLSVGKGSISRWENDVREPTLSYLSAYAVLFGVSLDYITGINTTKPHDKTPHEELAALVDQRPELYQLVETAKFLPPDGVKRMIRLVKFNIEEEKNK